MGMAPVAHVLWNKIMRHNPSNPKWVNRDRFVLSNGHACALLYSMLHISGFPVSMNDLKSFRQLNSITPGHPESHITPGVEVTTGPLGQGIANAVGLAWAEAHLAANFNRPGFTLFDNFTYCFCGDGCLQEGVAAEAASLAGHLGLGKLILIYDDNKITIDGATDLSFTEDVPKRFVWRLLRINVSSWLFFVLFFSIIELWINNNHTIIMFIISKGSRPTGGTLSPSLTATMICPPLRPP